MSELVYVKYQRLRRPLGVQARQRAKKRRATMKDNSKIRTYVFEREQGICRCCRIRKAESMHELVFRSLGGKVSKRNSVAVCGRLVGVDPSCHTYLQQSQIGWCAASEAVAEGLLKFQPRTRLAADWMRVERDMWVCSMPGGRNEEMQAC